MFFFKECDGVWWFNFVCFISPHQTQVQVNKNILKTKNYFWGHWEHFDQVLGQNSAKQKYSEPLCIKFQQNIGKITYSWPLFANIPH